MKLKALTLERFGGFIQKQCFQFPDKPGLYFLQGRNDMMPRLGSNGAGKTTLWKALFWLWFGKTPDGLKAGDVCSWGAAKGTRVSLDYVGNDGLNKTVTRTWAPNSWVLTVEGVTTDLAKGQATDLMADIGADFAPCLHSVLIAQEGVPFLDLKSEAQATLFSDVLELNAWVGYSERAGREASAIDRRVRDLETQQARLQGQLTAQEDFAPRYQAFENERRSRSERIEMQYGRLLQEEAKALDDVKRHAADVKRLKALEDELRVDVARQRDATDNARRAHEDALETERQLRWHLQANEKDMSTLETHETCPLCRVKLVAAADPASTIKVIEAESVELERDLKKAEGSTNAAQDFLTECKKDADELEALYRETQRMLTEISAKLAAATRNAGNIAKDLDDLEDDLDAVAAEKNPYQDVHQKTSRESARIQSELAQVQQSLRELNERLSVCTYWVRGFKDVRLQLIADALAELEIETNSAALELGLVGWELRFAIDRETRTGSIQRGFTCHVISPGNEKPVPWASWSGGERQRLRNAGEMGLSNLIRTRMGVGINLEVWDEPSRGLSPAGVKDLLDTLAKRAELEQRQIWVVDHTSHTYGGFSGGALVVKTEDGASVIQQNQS